MAVNDKRMHFRKSLHAEASIADVLGNTWSQVNFLDIARNGVAFISPEEQTAGSSRLLRFICLLIRSTLRSYAKLCIVPHMRTCRVIGSERNLSGSTARMWR
jgi:hypothetical protein